MNPAADAALPPPRGLAAMGIFLCCGAVLASLAGVTLVWRGTFLDSIWKLNPRAYAELAPLGKAPGLGFLLLGALLAVTAGGWFQRRLWGWWLAVAMMATQTLGGFLHILAARFLEGAVGLIIPGLILLYLLQPPVKTAFTRLP